MALRVRTASRTLSSSSAPAPAPAPMNLGFDLTFYETTAVKTKKLAVITGWMGAQPKQLRPYVNFYLSRGFNVLSYAVGPQHVLKPESATAMVTKVLDICLRSQGISMGSNFAAPREIITHSFSVGGYLTGQLLRVLDSEDREEDRQRMHELVKGQVYDSPPDLGSIAKGIGASVGKGDLLASVVENAIALYLFAVKDTAGKEHRASSAAFHDNHLPAPSLWMYSQADPVALEQDIDTVMNKWKAKGYQVHGCRWEHTKHIQHGRADPERYFSSVGTFIDKHTD